VKQAEPQRHQQLPPRLQLHLERHRDHGSLRILARRRGDDADARCRLEGGNGEREKRRYGESVVYSPIPRFAHPGGSGPSNSITKYPQIILDKALVLDRESPTFDLPAMLPRTPATSVTE
jgi:hypothetical protein